MFNRLRNRFLLLNVVIITVLMLAAFMAIYAILQRNVQADIEMDLRRIADFNRFSNSSIFGDVEARNVLPRRSVEPNVSNASERYVSFSLLVNEEGALTAVASLFDMEETFYLEALEATDFGKDDSGRIHLDGYDWEYVTRSLSDGYKRIVFLDVTPRLMILTKLVYTFFAVGAVMLILIFFISRYFANRAIAPVRSAFEKQKQFIADASHELKTPLTVIRTNTDVLLSNAQDSIQNQEKWLRYIVDETERMSKLTGDLLYLTQMEEAREEVRFVPFSASEAVEDVVLTMEAAIFEKNIKLETNFTPNLHIRGNRESFKQLVMILLDNAIKYINREGTIGMTLQRQHKEMVLTVSNTGEGIPPEHLDRIFDRFYRIDKSRSRAQGGYGLGLSIAKAIAEQHHGSIRASSVLGKETVFTVRLPLHD